MAFDYSGEVPNQQVSPQQLMQQQDWLRQQRLADALASQQYGAVTADNPAPGQQGGTGLIPNIIGRIRAANQREPNTEAALAQGLPGLVTSLQGSPGGAITTGNQTVPTPASGTGTAPSMPNLASVLAKMPPIPGTGQMAFASGAAGHVPTQQTGGYLSGIQGGYLSGGRQGPILTGGEGPTMTTTSNGTLPQMQPSGQSPMPMLASRLAQSPGSGPYDPLSGSMGPALAGMLGRGPQPAPVGVSGAARGDLSGQGSSGDQLPGAFVGSTPTGQPYQNFNNKPPIAQTQPGPQPGGPAQGASQGQRSAQEPPSAAQSTNAAPGTPDYGAGGQLAQFYADQMRARAQQAQGQQQAAEAPLSQPVAAPDAAPLPQQMTLRVGGGGSGGYLEQTPAWQAAAQRQATAAQTGVQETQANQRQAAQNATSILTTQMTALAQQEADVPKLVEQGIISQAQGQIQMQDLQLRREENARQFEYLRAMMGMRQEDMAKGAAAQLEGTLKPLTQDYSDYRKADAVFQDALYGGPDGKGNPQAQSQLAAQLVQIDPNHRLSAQILEALPPNLGITDKIRQEITSGGTGMLPRPMVMGMYSALKTVAAQNEAQQRALYRAGTGPGAYPGQQQFLAGYDPDVVTGHREGYAGIGPIKKRVVSQVEWNNMSQQPGVTPAYMTTNYIVQ